MRCGLGAAGYASRTLILLCEKQGVHVTIFRWWANAMEVDTSGRQFVRTFGVKLIFMFTPNVKSRMNLAEKGDVTVLKAGSSRIWHSNRHVHEWQSDSTTPWIQNGESPNRSVLCILIYGRSMGRCYAANAWNVFDGVASAGFNWMKLEINHIPSDNERWSSHCHAHELRYSCSVAQSQATASAEIHLHRFLCSFLLTQSIMGLLLPRIFMGRREQIHCNRDEDITFSLVIGIGSCARLCVRVHVCVYWLYRQIFDARVHCMYRPTDWLACVHLCAPPLAYNHHFEYFDYLEIIFSRTNKYGTTQSTHDIMRNMNL